MTPAEIKALREELRCNSRELAAALGIELRELMAWEAEERFPTRRHVRKMDQLREAGPDAMPRLRRPKPTRGTVDEALGDPEVWATVRKILAHPDLRAEVLSLAAAYDDPAER